MNIQKRSKYGLLISICAGFDILMLAFPFLLLDLAKAFGLFAIFIWMFFYCALIGFTIVSAIYSLLRFKKDTWKTLIPFLLNSITLFIFMFTPYLQTCMNIRTKIELQINKTKYQEIIKKVESGELQPKDESGFVYLSPTDGVLVNKSNSITSTFFAVDQGSRDYVGFMYRSDDSQPPTTKFLGTFWLNCEHEEPYWYYCSSY